MNRQKKKILIFVDWFLPGYKGGGPIQSVKNLISHIKDDFNIFVVTSNKDLGEDKPYKNIAFNDWIKREDFSIIYLDESHQNIRMYSALLNNENFHAVYFNSFFSKNFSLLPQWVLRSEDVKKVLAPRGMLGAGALQIKPAKKKLFLKLFKALGFHKKVVWQATSELEKMEIKKQFGSDINVILAPNLSSKMGTFKFKEKHKNHLRVFFLSRITLKKQLFEALKILQVTRAEIKIDFTIIGPIYESEYWEKCEEFILNMPKHINVDYLGAIPNHKLDQILQKQHLLLLPTMHENFGHVIMESWQNGCPVLISDQTPWRNLGEKKLGFDISIHNLEKFTEIIHEFSGMDEKSFNLWSSSSFEYAKAFTENPKLIKETKNLFL